MSSPIREDDAEQYSFPAFNANVVRPRGSSDEDGTLQEEMREENVTRDRPHVRTVSLDGAGHHDRRSAMSPSQVREQSQRLGDDLEMLRAEQVVSNNNSHGERSERDRSMARSRSRTNVEPIDDFDVSTTPIHEKAKIYQPPEHPATKVASFFKKVHNSSWLIRYFIYITPLTLILLIPLLLGAITYRDSTVGGVRLLWFSIWLEIVWLTLWAGRILAKCIPYPLGLIASLFTNNDKKWRDLGKQLEVPATLFFWWLAIEISFLPTMTNHHWDGNTGVQSWEDTMNKIIVSVFVGCVLNFAEKIIIQLIAISFHTRTYSDRIDINKFQIGSLVKLYSFSKQKIAMEDSEFEANDQGAKSGARTPMQYVTKAGKNARHVLARVGDVAGKVAGDFTGRQVAQSTHPQQVILSLLSTTSGSQVLARRLYRTFVPEGAEVVSPDDLRAAFDNDDEADSAFSMFDKDLNGDISMDELEAVCVEIGRERKAITASLKDLDSVVSKLDDVFVFIVLVITTLVFISLISTSASGVLTSAGSAVLALSWLFSATAQEFLQSIVFVFVKHPFDVGDRVTVYGNSGAMGMGDDYFVKEISLLFTEFKKMEGHVVQAPNSYLNTLFILNQRRSGALAEGVPIVIKFGTTLEQIDALRSRLLEFVTSENREYQKNILTELRNVSEAYSITLNVVFFYKSNWQNELLRLQRRNKFICALMVIMQDLGIEGPRQLLAGQSENMPFHHAAPIPPYLSQPTQKEGTGPQTVPLAREDRASAEHPGSPAPPQAHAPSTTLFVGGRRRGESISQMGKRIDFSLGMSAISSGAEMSDVYDKPRPRLPSITHTSPSPGPTRNRGGDAADDGRSLGLTTSRESKLGRVSSDASSRTHRNRFFGRGRSRFSTMEEGVTLHDLEAGPGRGMMPGIPESSGSPSGTTAATSRRNMENEHSMTGIRRIDPRTGIVSPQAVQRDSAIGRGELPRAVTEPFR